MEGRGRTLGVFSLRAMSEYQYYEFLSIDAPLDAKQMAALCALSTRADITSTSFTNVYQWGDFKFRKVHSRRSALLRRLDKAGLRASA